MSTFSAFERQVSAHEDRVYRFARSMLKDAATAQDVTQEVLVKLWEHQGRPRRRRARSVAHLRDPQRVHR